MAILVRGGGVAALGCIHLLRSAGFTVKEENSPRPRIPVIMLSDAAAALIRDVFGRPDLLRNLRRIERRVVAWGPDAKPVAFDHSAIVVSEERLIEAVRGGIAANREAMHDAGADEQPDWSIFSAGPLPSQSAEHSFGSRRASASAVELIERDGPRTCWIESLDNGWLFLIPETARSGWMLSVGGSADELLGRSRVVAGQVHGLQSSRGEFPASPRIVSPLCGPGWLACGTAAMAFDPICGDGAANALREAILASAVIRASVGAFNRDELLSHYETRLAAGFYRHLLLCLEYYRSGFRSLWWDTEAEAVQRGLESCAAKLRGRPEFRFQLNGFELEPAVGGK